MATAEEIASFESRSKEVVQMGENLYAKMQKEIEGQYPAGHFVVINVDTGEYVTGETSLKAQEKAREKFTHPIRGFVRKIVGPYPEVFFVGCPQ